MLPFEFTVQGPPVSHQARPRQRLIAWRRRVRAAAEAAWPAGHPPVADSVEISVCYYHEGQAVRIDTDNMMKPIQDALSGLVYEDDRLITDSKCRKTSLDGEFRVRGLSPVLAAAFTANTEFLHVRISAAPDHRELI